MQQQGLPFGVAEGIAIERKAAVANALSRVRADCYLSRFVCLVYQMTHGGQAGQFAASYQELAGNPLYLGVCSPRKAQSTVEHARDLGLVEVRPGRDDSGRPTANAYRIDWAGVRRLIGAAPAAAPSEPPPAPPVEISTPCYVPSTTCYVPSTGRQVLSTTCYPHAPQPIPAGETPRAPAHAPSTNEFIPTTTSTAEVFEALPAETLQPVALKVAGTLWPGKQTRLADRRDHRLVYRLALLATSEAHAPWVVRMLKDTADARAKNPPAWMQRRLDKYAPAGCDPERLLASIDVPRWALADPRDWCPNGETRQTE